MIGSLAVGYVRMVAYENVRNYFNDVSAFREIDKRYAVILWCWISSY